MRPTLYENDIIIVKEYNNNHLKENDIITFKHENRIISHKIINIENINGERIFHTKGDNNQIPDDFNIKHEQIYGKFLFRIPKIGRAVEYIQNENGLIKVFLLIIIVFILFGINDNKKNKRKITRKKYEIKKNRENYNELSKNDSSLNNK